MSLAVNNGYFVETARACVIDLRPSVATAALGRAMTGLLY